MNPPTKLQKEKIYLEAKSLIEGISSPLGGVRRLVLLASQSGLIQDEVFSALVGIESELDDVPSEAAGWDPDLTKAKTDEANEYLSSQMGAIRESCLEIIERFGESGDKN